MIGPDRLEALALSLPEAAVADHFGADSYRVRGKIFATVPDAEHVRVMLAEPEILALTEEDPETFEAVYWGKRLSAVAVALASVTESELSALLADGWRRKAPARLVRDWDSGAQGMDGREPSATNHGRRRT